MNVSHTPDHLPATERFQVRPVRRIVVGLSLTFGVVLTALSWLGRAVWIREPFSDLFSVADLTRRLLVGAGLGAGGAVLAMAVLWRLPSLQGFRRLVREGFEGIEPRLIDIVILSLVAGWSEELFFRGVLQPEIGVWFTSIAFVAVHGVVRIRSWGRLAFGLTLFTASSGLGYLCRWQQLESAMAAHATYDLCVLLGMRFMVAHRRRG